MYGVVKIQFNDTMMQYSDYTLFTSSGALAIIVETYDEE